MAQDDPTNIINKSASSQVKTLGLILIIIHHKCNKLNSSSRFTIIAWIRKWRRTQIKGMDIMRCGREILVTTARWVAQITWKSLSLEIFSLKKKFHSFLEILIRIFKPFRFNCLTLTSCDEFLTETKRHREPFLILIINVERFSNVFVKKKAEMFSLNCVLHNLAPFRHHFVDR